MIVGGEQAGQVDGKVGQVVERREKDQGQLSEEADRKVLPVGEDGDEVEGRQQEIVDGQGKKKKKKGGKVRFLIGVTATPDKADHKNLGEYFDSKAFEYSMPRAIREGYLCPIKAQMIPLELDINNVSVSNGDYAVGEIGNALEPYLNQIALEMCNYCKNKKTVVFLPLVKTSQKFTELLNVHGLRAVEVNGNSKDREERIKAFENGEYDVLCNSMLLTEGWDCPSVDCIVILRPTKVRSLYQQMVGRGMRLAPNKEYLLLLDFLWLTERHDLCKPSGLLVKNEEEAKKIDEKIANSGYEVDLVEAEEEAKRDIIAERENALKRELEEMRRKKRQLVDPIQYAFSINCC